MTITSPRPGSIYGNRVTRTEDPELITGTALYTGDLPVEGSYHAVFVRSPVAHGDDDVALTADAVDGSLRELRTNGIV